MSLISEKTSRTLKTLVILVLGLIGAVIIYWDQEAARTRNNSNISFVTGDENPFVIKSDGHWTFARIQVWNKSSQEAICRLFLTDVEKVGESKPVLKNENIMLAVGNQGGGDQFQEQKIGTGFRLLFDLAYSVPSSTELKIPARGSAESNQFTEVASSNLLPGTYIFTVRTNGKNCASEPATVSLKFSGWPNLSVLKGLQKASQ